MTIVSIIDRAALSYRLHNSSYLARSMKEQKQTEPKQLHYSYQHQYQRQPVTASPP